MGALAALLAPVQSGKDRNCRVQSREEVDDRDPDPHRLAAGLAVGLAGDAHQPAHTLDDVIVAGAVGVRPILAEAGDRGDHEARVRVLEGGRVEAEFAEAADLEIFDHDIGLAGEAPDQSGALLGCEVDCCGALAAVR
jgi:hypothetical protein